MEWTWGWAGVIVSVLAAAVAVWQAVDARAARTEAARSQASAETAAAAAAAAQRKSAEALAAIATVVREQHDAAKAAAAKKPDPWSLDAGRFMRTGKAVLLRLSGNEEIVDIDLSWDRAPTLVHYEPSPVPTTMRPGDAIEIVYMFSGGQTTAVLEVSWKRDGDAERHVTRATLN